MEAEPAHGVARLELPRALLGSRIPDALSPRVPWIACGRGARTRAEDVVARLALRDRLGVERAVPGRDAEVRGPLEHRQLRGLGRDDRDRLNRRGAGADHAHALACDVDSLVRPETRVVHLPCEPLAAGDVGDARNRQTARRHDQEGRARSARRRRLRPTSDRRVPRGSPRRRECRAGGRAADRSDPRRARGRRGSRPVRRSAPTTSTPARARATTSRSTSCSRCRSGRRGSDSRTTSRRRRSPGRSRGRRGRSRAAGAGDAARRCRRRR